MRSSLRAGSCALPAAMIGLAGFAVYWTLAFAALAVRDLLYLLPGIPDLDGDPRNGFVAALATVPLAGGAWICCSALVRSEARPVQASWQRLRRVAGFELDAWGVRGQGVGSWLSLVAAGLGGALVVWGLGGQLASAFNWDVPRTDPRDVTGAPGWSAVLFGLVGAPLVEEVLYRGPLLILVAGVAQLRRQAVLSNRSARVLQLAGLLVAAGLFGWVHLQYSLFNAVVAVVGGLVWGRLALWGRSLLPALVGHGLYDAAVFGLQAMGQA